MFTKLKQTFIDCPPKFLTEGEEKLLGKLRYWASCQATLCPPSPMGLSK